MAQFDRFAQSIFKFKADLLVIATGERVVLGFGTDKKPVSAEAATRTQVEGIVREIAPPHLAPQLSRDGEHEFLYRSPSGLVQVRVARKDSSVRLTAVPAASDAEEAPLPAAIPVLAETSTGEADGFMSEAAPESSAEPEAASEATSMDYPREEESSQDPPALFSQGEAPSPQALEAIEGLLRRLISEKCSDLHLSSGNPPMFRKDGTIVAVGGSATMSPATVREMVFAIAPAKSRREFDERHDTDFAYEIAGLARYRCNLYMDRLGVGGVFRVIPSKTPSVDELGLPKHILQLCQLSKGLVLVTGPTGSGKSTTLAALVDWINRNRTDHIITIEDPIEFVHANQKCLVNQRQVGVHTEGFKPALRAALREDPDIVLVGELRDLETMAIAIETAETGHLVFGTLHTNSAPSTVDRIIDQFPSDRQSQIRTMLSESLKGVVSQTLCRKKGGGRVAAYEILYVTSAISNLIREGKTFQIPSIMQTNKALGMTLMNEALLDLVHKGLVEPQEAYFKSAAKTEFKALLERNHIKIETT
ncbi:MAG TPA: PilT/PilU family type 4a pilus ATPase [Candidatus Polarisedimenticolia bacterium]|nr:PilT/PilU family type 4a pilus ATPase [Candidatus Polarisedimenticolia bacterium]